MTLKFEGPGDTMRKVLNHLSKHKRWYLLGLSLICIGICTLLPYVSSTIALDKESLKKTSNFSCAIRGGYSRNIGFTFGLYAIAMAPFVFLFNSLLCLCNKTKMVKYLNVFLIVVLGFLVYTAIKLHTLGLKSFFLSIPFYFIVFYIIFSYIILWYSPQKSKKQKIIDLQARVRELEQQVEKDREQK